ncbi:hypothetical protein POTOM_001462 [Populus tomentosa]|uniref:Uncharacterized protein n=1 Tax=Populus tomentosa TaxID=118781 RepID=A0A8X8IW41_POPTO|nr:hypothetical protein POTOM_001462 [Populus tomentosa]
MAATRESIKGNGSSVQGALFRDRCCRRWWTKGQHRATCTTFLEGQIWKSSKTMAMTWLTQSSLAEFRSVFGNSFNIIGIASAYLFLSVPIDTRTLLKRKGKGLALRVILLKIGWCICKPEGVL